MSQPSPNTSNLCSYLSILRFCNVHQSLCCRMNDIKELQDCGPIVGNCSFALNETQTLSLFLKFFYLDLRVHVYFTRKGKGDHAGWDQSNLLGRRYCAQSVPKIPFMKITDSWSSWTPTSTAQLDAGEVWHEKPKRSHSWCLLIHMSTNTWYNDSGLTF